MPIRRATRRTLVARSYAPAPFEPLETRQLLSAAQAAPAQTFAAAGPAQAAPRVAGEDAYEENDYPAIAYALPTASGSPGALACQATATDNDFHRVRAAAGAFTATLDSVAADGELNIERPRPARPRVRGRPCPGCACSAASVTTAAGSPCPSTA